MYATRIQQIQPYEENKPFLLKQPVAMRDPSARHETLLIQSSCWAECDVSGGVMASTYSMRRISSCAHEHDCGSVARGQTVDVPVSSMYFSSDTRRNSPLIRKSNGRGVSVHIYSFIIKISFIPSASRWLIIWLSWLRRTCIGTAMTESVTAYLRDRSDDRATHERVSHLLLREELHSELADVLLHASC
jgi:hypothetical protein